MMLVSEIMTFDPITIDQNASVARALEIMVEMEYQQLPVMSDQGHVVGLISQRECRRALGIGDGHVSANSHKHKEDVRVHRHMQPAPIIVEPETPLYEAARLMTTHHLRALPVMRGESLVGILTVSDLLIAFMRILRRHEKAGGVLEDNSRQRTL
jgi:CBS domain-containing protein